MFYAFLISCAGCAVLSCRAQHLYRYGRWRIGLGHQSEIITIKSLIDWAQVSAWAAVMFGSAFVLAG